MGIIDYSIIYKHLLNNSFDFKFKFYNLNLSELQRLILLK